MKNKHVPTNGTWLKGYKEVGLHLGCSRNTAMEIVRKCKIPVKRISKRLLLFRIRDVDRCVEKYGLGKYRRKNT